ncbi:hypothetical protein AB0M28_05090 [Streptomyces sp. NPDC051940]|uniref:hypothetical protein n=1 Tax=Streptomyces sp. NPDC051940 TaxID=3155675 RepID=UPI00341380E5
MTRTRRPAPALPRRSALLLPFAPLAAGCRRIGGETPGPPDPPGGLDGAWRTDYTDPRRPSYLSDLVGVSADEAWGVVLARPEHPSGLLHLSAGRWRREPLPGRYDDAAMLRLAASGPDDVWLYAVAQPVPWLEQPVDKPRPVLRRHGGRWHTVPVDFGVLSLATAGPGQTWAADERGILRHWDGRRWRKTDLPGRHLAQGTTVVRALAVDARTADDIWVAGTQITWSGPEQPAVLHGDGRTWRTVGTPTYRFDDDSVLREETAVLTAIRALGPGEVWASGTHTRHHEDEEHGGPQDEYFRLRWDGARFVPAPSLPRSPDVSGALPLPVPDGAGGQVHGGWLRRRADGTFRGIGAPAGTGGWAGSPTGPTRLQVYLPTPLPGTRTVLGAGRLSTGESAQAVVVRYDAP